MKKDTDNIGLKFVITNQTGHNTTNEQDNRYRGLKIRITKQSDHNTVKLEPWGLSVILGVGAK